MNASDYQPPRWLRNPHVQSVLGSSALRRIRSRQLLAAAGARTSEHILDGGDIFQAAVEAGVPVQPVALRYGERGNAQAVVAFGERESFFANIVRLLGERSRLAEVHFLEPIGALDIDGRRRLADTSRQRILAAMES